MKENEAPEKIYINSNLENRTWLIGKGDISSIEYVRTDIFIEKVVSCIKERYNVNKQLKQLRDKVEKMMYDFNQTADIASTGELFDEEVEDAKYQLCKEFLFLIDSMGKETSNGELEKEITEAVTRLK